MARSFVRRRKIKEGVDEDRGHSGLLCPTGRQLKRVNQSNGKTVDINQENHNGGNNTKHNPHSARARKTKGRVAVGRHLSGLPPERCRCLNHGGIDEPGMSGYYIG
jgi:hypothetical protein